MAEIFNLLQFKPPNLTCHTLQPVRKGFIFRVPGAFTFTFFDIDHSYNIDDSRSSRFSLVLWLVLLVLLTSAQGNLVLNPNIQEI